MKRSQSIAIAVLTAALLAACATPYQQRGATGGFSETQLSENVFRVVFNGNGYTRSERAEDFVLLRSAELTLQNGFTHFAIADARTSTSVSSYTTPSTSYTTGSAYRSGNNIYGNATTTTYGGGTTFVSRPSATNTIVMFRERPNVQGMVFDAKFLTNSLRKKYASEFEAKPVKMEQQ